MNHKWFHLTITTKTKKVIYALNSKNDESEHLIDKLKAQYDDEKAKIIDEMSRRVDEYKEKFAQTNDQTKRIISLESALEQYQAQK